MFRIVLCAATQHDWRLVLVAALVCVAATSATFFLYSKVPPFPLWRRCAWLGMTGLVAGSGIWTTHFVAMLAFRTGLPAGYAAPATIGSLFVAVVSTALGFAFASGRLRQARPNLAAIGGGLMVGLGITLMHYLGMAGYRTAGIIQWDPVYVGASVLVGALLAAAALMVARSESRWLNQAGAAGLLTLGIVGMHFTGMAAVSITPDMSINVPTSMLSDGAMIVAAVVATTLIIVTSMTGVAFDGATRIGSLRRLQEALDVMPEGLAFYDAEDRLTAWNAPYAAQCRASGAPLTVGLPFDELLLAKIAHGVYPDAAGREREWIADRRAARFSNVGSLSLQTAEGRWLRVTERRTADGGLVCVSVDITDLKRAEEDAESANRAKSAFLATMSHEIRTPLNGVLGMAQAMAADELTTTQRGRLDIIRHSGQLLLAILNDVLDIAKIEAGKLEIEQIDFDLSDIIEGPLATFTELANRKGLEFRLELEDAARGVYHGDPTRLRQILYNLTSNAVKFTEQGEVRLKIARDGELLVLAVADTGIGISDAHRARLFSRFVQADASTTRRFGGTGLGLAISRQLVVMMGGTLDVETRPGVGSTFTVRVPVPRVGDAIAQTDRPADQVTETLEGSSALRVLAAEDNPVNQLVLKTLLYPFGIEPVIVDDGAKAVDAWRAEAWDLILMDIQMPVMDGLEATRTIRRLESAEGRRRTPILALTANAMTHQIAGYASAGIDGHVSKPIDVQVLIAAIQTAIAGADAEPDAAQAMA